MHQQVGNLIDWYNIQFYNQVRLGPRIFLVRDLILKAAFEKGVSEYTTCETLLNKSSDTWPETSVMQISKTVGLHKSVIGKIGTPADGNNGYMAPEMLAQCLAELKSKGWDAGAMVWEVSCVHLVKICII